MALQLRRGTTAERLLIVPKIGELIYDTQLKQLFTGDGATAGGNATTGSGGGGGVTALDELTDVLISSPVADQVLKFNGTTWVNVTETQGTTDSINSLEEDLTPTLGGDLVLNSYNITGFGDINITGGIHSTDASFDLLVTNTINGANNTIVFECATGEIPVAIRTVTNGISNPVLELASSKGTVYLPQDTVAGDTLSGVKITGWHNGTYKFASAIISEWESTATLSDTAPKAKLLLVTGGGNSKFNIASLDSNGNFTSPTITPGVYATIIERDLAIPQPIEGMMIFNAALQKYQGYVSDTGLASGGVSNSTPGWISLN